MVGRNEGEYNRAEMWVESISLYLFSFHEFSEDVLRMVSEVGFKGIELWGMKPHFKYDDLKFVRRAGSMLEKFGLLAGTFHAPLYIPRGGGRLWFALGAKDEALSSLALNETIKCAEAMEELGAEVMVVHIGAGGDGEKFLRDIETILRKTKLKVAVENEPTGFPLTEDIIGIVDKMGDERVGMCMDIGHAFIYDGDPAKSIKLAGNRIIAIHVSDNDGQNDLHNIPGSGVVDWKGVVEALKDIKYTGKFTYEIADHSCGKANQDELKEILKKTKNSLLKLLSRI